MKNSVRVLSSLVAPLLMLGCGSEDGGGSPADKCDDLVVSLCGRGADCVVELGCDPAFTRDQEYQQCLTAARDKLACGNAKAVGSSYGDCVSGLGSMACSAFGTSAACVAPTLPTACNGVILF